MSTPYPLEEQAQLEDAGTAGVWDPWKGPTPPRFFSGLGFTEDNDYLGPLGAIDKAVASGIDKGAATLFGAWHGVFGAMAYAGEHSLIRRAPGTGALEALEQTAGQAEQAAYATAKRNTPDPATTGAAAQMLHSVVSGATRYALGSAAAGPIGGAALVGASEATSRFHELTEQGIDTGTAAESAAGTGLLAGAGAFIPGGFGSTLFSRVASGAAANAALGIGSRYLDHTILERAGYRDMADQERVWDRTQLLSDVILGAAFGGLAHAQHAAAEAARQRFLKSIPTLAAASGAEDAARVMEIAAADRNAAPGIPADPQAAAAHQAALEKATADLLRGEPVNVADTGIAEANLLSRPERPSAELGRQVIDQAFERANVEGEQQSLADLEEQLAARLRGEQPAAEPVQTSVPTVLPRPSQEGHAPGSEPTFAAGRGLDTPEAIGEHLAAAAAGERRAPREIAVGQGSARAVIPLEELREAVTAKGFDGFDDAPPEAIAETVRELAARKLEAAAPAVHGNTPAERLLAEFENRHPQNPDQPTERLLGGKVGVDLARDPFDPATVHVNAIRSLEQGKGHGTVATRELAALADKHGVRITLDAQPLEAEGISAEKLKEWYRRFGFKVVANEDVMPLMEREAGAAGAKVISPADIPRAPEGKLSATDRAIEDRFARAIAADYEGMKARYAELEDSGGGKILNTDTARELSPDYLADRTRSAAVHEPASWFIKQLYAEKLREAPGPGEEPFVLFTAGGTGAGKSSAVKGALGDLERRAQIVMDSNMNGLESAVKKIEQAKAAGKDVRIVYVYRHPVEALERGALTRAMKQEGKFGSGRTVPIEEHLITHSGASRVVRELAARYAGDSHVDIVAIDNSRGAGKSAVVRLEHLPEVAHNEHREQALQTLDRELEAGRISPAVYRGFAGREPGERGGAAAAGPGSGAAPAEPAGLGPAARGEPQPQRPERRSDELTQPAATGTHQVMTATGRRIEVAPKLVELSELVTSDRPEYPAELQPRQRGARAALTEQVRAIARNLNPELLGNAPEADRGAPITGPGNVVESGNGRAFALREVYANHPEQAAAYRAFLERQGYDTSGMKEPVLVRERVTPLEASERRAFTVEANQTSVAALSPVERAQADARLLDASSLSQLKGGDIATAQNAAFVRTFLERLPQAERNALVNPDGTVSQEGVRRLQAAILAKAYGGAPESNAVLGRMLESTDNDMRSTLGAALDAAPAFARLRQAIEDGKIGPEYDISRSLTQAIELNAQVREKGQALPEFLKQQDFLTRRAPIVDALLKALYDRKGERLAGREKVAQTLMNYADRAIKQRLDQGMLFGDPPASPEQLLEPPPEEGGPAPMKPGADMFGLRTPQGGKREVGPGAVAAQALERNPNLEIPDETGEAQRARAELMAADEGVEKADERAPSAIDAAANCAGQRAA